MQANNALSMQLRRGRRPPDVPRLGAGGDVCVCVAGRGCGCVDDVAEISEDEDVSSPQGSSAAPRYHAGAGCRAQCHGLGPAASGECASPGALFLAPAAPARSSFAPRCLRRACVFWAGRTGSRRRAAPATATWPCRMRACTRWPVPSTRAHVRRRRASMHTAASLAYPRTTRAPQPALSHRHAHPRRSRIALGF